MFFSENKRNAAIGGQIPVPDVGPSANWLNYASLAVTLATAEICMKYFRHRCLRSFCRFCGQNSTFSIVFIILDNQE